MVLRASTLEPEHGQTGFLSHGSGAGSGTFWPAGRVCMNIRGDVGVMMFSLAQDTHTQNTVFLLILHVVTLSFLAGMVVFSHLGFIPGCDRSVGNLTLCAVGSSPEPSVSVCCQSPTGSNSISPSDLP